MEKFVPLNVPKRVLSDNVQAFEAFGGVVLLFLQIFVAGSGYLGALFVPAFIACTWRLCREVYYRLNLYEAWLDQYVRVAKRFNGLVRQFNAYRDAEALGVVPPLADPERLTAMLERAKGELEGAWARYEEDVRRRDALIELGASTKALPSGSVMADIADLGAAEEALRVATDVTEKTQRLTLKPLRVEEAMQEVEGCLRASTHVRLPAQ